MECERKIYPTTYHYANGYKACIASGHDSGVVIFIKKRFLGFLWWIYVKDRFNNPVTYNHKYNAIAFMNHQIKYYDHITNDLILVDGRLTHSNVRKMTDEDAWKRISDRVEEKVGTRPELDCVKRAWEFDGKNYIHVATEYASLWHSIHEQGGKKLWIK